MNISSHVSQFLSGLFISRLWGCDCFSGTFISSRESKALMCSPLSSSWLFIRSLNTRKCLRQGKFLARVKSVVSTSRTEISQGHRITLAQRFILKVLIVTAQQNTHCDGYTFSDPVVGEHQRAPIPCTNALPCKCHCPLQTHSFIQALCACPETKALCSAGSAPQCWY